MIDGTAPATSSADGRFNPIRMLVVSADPEFSTVVATCCCTLAMTVRSTSEADEAAEALSLGEADIAFIDGNLGLERIAAFVRQLRTSLCVDWAPVIVAGSQSSLRNALSEAVPGMVDHVINRLLAHDEMHECLVAARRVVSLKRAFDSTLDRVTEAVIVIDDGGRVHSFNAAAKELFQWDATEMRGASVERLMPRAHRGHHDGYVDRYQRTGEAKVIGRGRIESGQRRDGSQFPMRLTVSDISDSYGTRFVGVIRDLTGDQEAEAMRMRALHDALTTLPNQAFARQELIRCCDEASARGRAFALLYLDLDRFKPINDTHGHSTGDEVLKAVARRLRHALSDKDFVARLGGDEFLVVLHGVTKREQAEDVAQRLKTTVCRPIGVASITVSVGISVGIAIHGPDGVSAEALLQTADQAMYENKRQAQGVASDAGANSTRA